MSLRSICAAVTEACLNGVKRIWDIATTLDFLSFSSPDGAYIVPMLQDPLALGVQANPGNNQNLPNNAVQQPIFPPVVELPHYMNLINDLNNDPGISHRLGLRDDDEFDEKKFQSQRSHITSTCPRQNYV